MRAAVFHGAGDIRLEDRLEPTIIEPRDAIVRISATCICGSALWDYRGLNPDDEPKPIGHEYCDIVEERGNDGVQHVSKISPRGMEPMRSWNALEPATL